MSFFKVLVVGEVATGKSSLVSRLVQNTFQESYKATIGCEFGFKLVTVDGQSIRIQLWDLAGQDRLGGISRLYCRDANGVLVVCDATKPETMELAAKWKEKVDENVRLPDGSPIPTVLCVNKSDLISNSDRKQAEIGQSSNSYGFPHNYMTSAKTGHNVDEALSELVGLIAKTATAQPQKQQGSKLVVAKGTEKRCSC